MVANLRNCGLRGLRLLVISYGLICLAAYSFQDRLLYSPGTSPTQHPLVVEPQGRLQGVMLLFHGNAGTAWDRLHYAEATQPAGIRLVLAEYPGYGGREGTPSEASLVADGVATYEKLVASLPPGIPLLLAGESLGSSVATQVAVRVKQPPQQLILITPFDKLARVAAEKFWFLPVQWLLRDTYATDEALQRYRGEVHILIAKDDEIVGADAGLRLAKHATNARKLTLTQFDGGHNTPPPDGWLKKAFSR